MQDGRAADVAADVIVTVEGSRGEEMWILWL
jgi:hypothetical protein